MARRADQPQGTMPTSPPPKPGDYWKLLDPQTLQPMVAGPQHWTENGGNNATHTVWMVVLPDGGTRTVQDTTVTENADGTVSTPPPPGQVIRYGDPTNPAKYWQGYIDHDTFVAVPLT